MTKKHSNPFVWSSQRGGRPSLRLAQLMLAVDSECASALLADAVADKSKQTSLPQRICNKDCERRDELGRRISVVPDAVYHIQKREL